MADIVKPALISFILACAVVLILWESDALARWIGAGERSADVIEVVRVIDGDTILVHRDGEEERVRLLGVDAPEVERDGQAGERCAAEATALTEDLTQAGTVELIVDTSQPETDRYGRTLAYVEAGGEDVSAELLRAGLAELYYSASDIERYDEYEDIAEQAGDPDCAQ